VDAISGQGGWPDGYREALILDQVVARVLPAKIDPGRNAFVEIARPRLQSGARGVPAFCTVVQAPAGYGKTALLRQWRREMPAGHVFGWLRCDRDDNDVRTFLRGLTAALSSAGLGNLPDIEASDGLEWKSQLNAVIGAIGQAGLSVWLVLDDFHEIVSEQVCAALSHLSSYPPEDFHLVLSGRRRPRLPLSHLAASGRVRWLRAEDLRFDLRETRQFLEAQADVELDPFDIEPFFEATQGWPAGLQLAAIDIARAKRKEDAIAAFTGLTAEVSSYFDECVMDPMQPGAADLLTQLSVLDELARPVCEVIVGAGETGFLFDLLAQGELLADRRHERGESYVLHPLFRTYLRTRLDRSEAFSASDLHRRAGAHFAGLGQWPQAVQHAFSSGDTKTALEWAERCAVYEIGKGDPLRVTGWLGHVSGEELSDRWPLLAAMGTAYALSLRLDDARAIAATIEGIVAASADGPDAGKLAAYLKTLQLCIAYMSDDIPLMLGLAEGFIGARDRDDHWPRIVVSNALIHGNLVAGEIERARQFEPLGQSEIDDPNEFFSAAYQICLLGLCDVAEVKLMDAEARFRRAYGLAEKSSGRKTAVTALCASLLAAVSYEHDRVEEAETLVFGRLELIEQTGFVEALQNCYVTLARIHAARGNWKVAHSILDRGVLFARRRGLVRLRGACLAERIEISLKQGQVGKAQALMSELGWIVPQTGVVARSAESYVRQLHLHASGLVALARGRTKDACAILERYVASEGWDDYATLRARIQLAVALEGEGRLLQAQDAMGDAVLAAAAGGLIRSFLDAGAAARALLKLVLDRMANDPRAMASATYRSRLSQALAREDADGQRGGVVVDKPRLAQAAMLTERELDLLSRVRRGLTNKEIAGELGIGVETVKWHLKNVFGKLKVKNRAGAVACAAADPRRG